MPSPYYEGKVSADRLTDEVFIKSFAVRQTQIYLKHNNLIGRKNESTDFKVCALVLRLICNFSANVAENLK